MRYKINLFYFVLVLRTLVVVAHHKNQACISDINSLSNEEVLEIFRVGRYENFYLFIPEHRRVAGKLIDISLEVCDTKVLAKLAATLKGRINTDFFNYVFSAALLLRPDTQNLTLRSWNKSLSTADIDHTFTDTVGKLSNEDFFDLTKSTDTRRDFTVLDSEEDITLEYFTNNLAFTEFHWNWHLVYPNRAAINRVKKIRRGELFYYMHHAILSRYDFERLSNDFQQVCYNNTFDKPVGKILFPAFNGFITKYFKTPQIRQEIVDELNDMETWKSRIIESIEVGFLKGPTGNILLKTDKSLDLLGNVVESSDLSVNEDYYGNLHDTGHTLISLSSRPDNNRPMRPEGKMEVLATNLVQSVFYRWHAFVDSIFQEQNNLLPSYTKAELSYPEVSIINVEIQINGQTSKTLHTFWEQAEINISANEYETKFIDLIHLQHRQFSYKIKVRNSLPKNLVGICRIFLGPKYDIHGNVWNLADQKNTFIELDKFKVDLHEGDNEIFRSSNQSSVTVPVERLYAKIKIDRLNNNDDFEDYIFGRCGWPANLLIPKGNPQGFPSQLFVMISNDKDDNRNHWKDYNSLCGTINDKCPDQRPMGFPFNRLPKKGITTLNEFLTSNMHVQDILIKHYDEVISK